MAKVIYDEGLPVLRSDWHIEDIMSQAEDMGIELTMEDVERVMYLIARTHDACIGINWEVIEEAIDTIMEDAHDSHTITKA